MCVCVPVCVCVCLCVHSLHSIDAGEIPSLAQLGFGGDALARLQHEQRGGGLGANLQLHGGETHALAHLQALLAEVKRAAAAGLQQQPVVSASGCSGSAPGSSSSFSAKISPWLALGCLSPRQIMHELKLQLGGVAVAAGGCSGPVPGPGLQQSVPASASWLVFELLWRDFFRFITHKYSVQAMGLKEAATAAAPGLLMAA